MKQFIYTSTLVCFVFLAMTACDTSILDKQPLDTVSEENVWQDPALTEAYVNELYVGMGRGFGETMMSSHADESHFIHGRGTIDVVQSNISPSNMGTYTDDELSHTTWGAIYENVRSANIFLNNIEDAAVEESLKERLTGEVYFLRAYFYYMAFRQWGGVPLVDQVYELGQTEEMLIPRNTLEETVNFIVSDLDEAASRLPLEYSGEDVGRATRGAALALKSRVLLYAASDLYHDPSWAGGYSNPEYISYSGANRTQMWRDAKNAAKAVMDLGVYQLYDQNPDPVANYTEMYLNNSSETIMSLNVNSEFPYEYNEADHGLYNGPNGYHTWGGNVPIQKLVDDFDMEDGSEFDWQEFENGDPVYGDSPYENRDPRFYANIMYDGADWQQRPPDVTGDPEGRIQTFLEYYNVDDNGNRLNPDNPIPGLDTRSSPIEDWNGTTTGYYVRKFMDPAVDHQNEIQEVPWPYFRYAEILLNYAEASIELGEYVDARRELNKVRSRAGMPDITESGQALMEQYRDERRIELMYEEHRFFDVRRWMIAPDELDDNALGIYLTAEHNENDPYYEYTYSDIELIEVQQRAWENKMYLYPIPREEVNRNDQLVQNPLYSTN
ncbi:RagB/SusD family nutrient uptake outer membrane protein [Halalkalibaculum sp. DA3122]|uniref:RagB/SusD family nutrient uptake outer membrane protein n=1 Tax=Halalkalibaculum sp. DA3122 TaxID=3373607 RepID=UPI0037546D67